MKNPFSISTNVNQDKDKNIYWRFQISDSLGNTTYLPASGGYAYTDTFRLPVKL